MFHVLNQIFKLLSAATCAEWFISVRKPEDKFSRDKAHFTVWVALLQNQKNGIPAVHSSDRHGNPPSVSRVYAVRMMMRKVFGYPVCLLPKLWLDCGEAQVELRIHMALFLARLYKVQVELLYSHWRPR